MPKLLLYPLCAVGAVLFGIFAALLCAALVWVWGAFWLFEGLWARDRKRLEETR